MYWVDIAMIILGAIGICMLTFGVWGCCKWDQYSKLLDNIKAKLIK